MDLTSASDADQDTHADEDPMESVGLTVADLDSAVEWWTEVTGLKLSDASPEIEQSRAAVRDWGERRQR
eukprot:680534-Rhodomonas_salina.1